ncbi:response regulator transcription factor [Cupriavidus pinatubonensis]|uniref:Transcriptional regulator n=1 Tax=Cupriavidus pinatubonensis TaxID=248026 RepID=A0ABM8XZZ8_9BURK|nr:response regulator transcription factor [Cupriavidus pinatubonensis]QYY28481.1 response regulator transcription factor [Cupriavidus pinatubonensis]TPQ36384.1 DNA-binding response regulator [Cupriavidus pinatubonensis]CAG9185982.1 Putative transcriptional regulator [Cupriavidus pinatubonensis]
MATILIVDDHPAVRVVLKTHLSQVLGVTHVLEADNGQAAVEIVRQYAPDVVILDLDIPRINGLDVIPRLKAIQPSVRILVISGQDQNTFAPRARQAGANGYVSKTQELPEIVRCVESVLAGYSVMPDVDGGRADGVDETRRLGSLSDKELVIMQMLAKGMSNKQIGEVLFISNKTVSTHKTRIMEKLGARSLVDVIDFARRHHIAIG